MSDPKFYFTKKELAQAMGRSTRFVRFMELGGFVLPATMLEAVNFIRENPFPSRFQPKKKK
jgi:hypothetical protein